MIDDFELQICKVRNCVIYCLSSAFACLTFYNYFYIKGFTDLGEFTPDNLKHVNGDHALVMMFQPFRGKWVQSIACFLSKNAASGKIILIILIIF